MYTRKICVVVAVVALILAIVLAFQLRKARNAQRAVLGAPQRQGPHRVDHAPLALQVAVLVLPLPVSATTLVMPLVGALDSARLQLVQEQALRSIERTGSQRLVLDITGVPLVDSQVAQGLLAVVQAARLLGAEAVLVGVRPEVAQTMVGLGLSLPGLRAYADLQTAVGRLSALHR